MSTTPAFDLALVIDNVPPQHVNDAPVVQSLGPPLSMKFAPVVVSSTPGVTVDASVPKANAQNQILVSGSGPTYPWGLATNPAVAATVPPPTGANRVLMSDSTLTWKDTALSAFLSAGNAVVTNGGALYTFDSTSVLAFTASLSMATRLDGGDPTKSEIDNFSIDAGTF